MAQESCTLRSLISTALVIFKYIINQQIYTYAILRFLLASVAVQSSITKSVRMTIFSIFQYYHGHLHSQRSVEYFSGCSATEDGVFLVKMVPSMACNKAVPRFSRHRIH